MSIPVHATVLLHDGPRLLWRAAMPDPGGNPLRAVTWDICSGATLTARADLDREGQMREVDFREVRGQLNSIVISRRRCGEMLKLHRDRLRGSLIWQRRIPAPESQADPCHGPCHLRERYFDPDFGWMFPWPWPDEVLPEHLQGPVLRPASNRMLVERNLERTWAVHWTLLGRWLNHCLRDDDLDRVLGHSRDACCWRLLHYWRSPECRQLFTSSPQLAAVFCSPGCVAALDDPADGGWLATATRLARLPRREWMELLGLPPTQQVVRLFSRVDPWQLASWLPLVRDAFADPLTRKRLSHTTCRIDDTMLRMCQAPGMLVRWPLYRELCCRRRRPSHLLAEAQRAIDFFGTNRVAAIFRRALQRARTEEGLKSCLRVARWLRCHWGGLFEPGTDEALARLRAPLADRDGIRMLNDPVDLLETAARHRLCLDRYLLPISRGEYALYEIRHLDQFAVAGIARAPDGRWEIDQIRGHDNEAPSELLRAFVEEWGNAGNQQP